MLYRGRISKDALGEKHSRIFISAPSEAKTVKSIIDSNNGNKNGKYTIGLALEFNVIGPKSENQKEHFRSSSVSKEKAEKLTVKRI